MSERHGGRGRRGFSGREGRGRGRGGGRAAFRSIAPEDGVREVERISDALHIGSPRLSANINEPDRPQYPPGTIGNQVQCTANYFPLDCQLERAFHYQVDIECEYNAGVERMVMDRLAEEEGWPNGWVFDGRSALYTAGEFIPRETREVEVVLQHGQRTRKLKTKMQCTGSVEMRQLEQYTRGRSDVYPAEPVRVLEVLLGHSSSLIPNSLLHRKSVFIDEHRNRHDIGKGAEAWMGYHQSVRPCQTGLYLNIDASCAPFYKPVPVVQFFKEVLGLNSTPTRLNDQQHMIIRSVMKNLMVTLIRGNDKRKVKGLLTKPSDLYFEHREFGKISVIDYYERTNHRLEYPQLPCLDCSKGARQCFVPPECARIGHAQYVTKIEDSHKEQMIRLASQNPNVKENFLNGLIRNQANVNNLGKVSEFQFSSPNPEMKLVRARILPSPFLAYKEPPCLDVGGDGQWNLGQTRVNFYKGKKLKSWALVCMAEQRTVNVPGDNGIDAFLGELTRAMQIYGVASSNITPPPIVYATEHDISSWIRMARDEAVRAYDGRHADIILCLLPRRVKRMYRSTKKTSDTDIGIPTQCFAADKAGIGGRQQPRGRPQYCANLALKINVKVGGTNSVLMGAIACGLPMVNQRRPYMVLGADVSHPSPGSQLASIAAVVGSMDPMASRYSSRTTHQTTREETIIDMKPSVKGLLKDFYEHNKQRRPEAIIVFRDGVSEGFFSKVLTHEYRAIREACNEMGDPGAEYAPPITYICIQKKHHTRLFPKTAAGKYRDNVRPGTVVDSEITSPFGHDFFLCAQAGIQGTVRPAHYHVLVDENNLGSDALQVMCYWMCYMQCRCTKSVSLPAPASYAHLAALRARMIAGEDSDDEASSLASGAGTSASGGSGFDISQGKMYYV